MEVKEGEQMHGHSGMNDWRENDDSRFSVTRSVGVGKPLLIAYSYGIRERVHTLPLYEYSTICCSSLSMRATHHPHPHPSLLGITANSRFELPFRSGRKKHHFPPQWFCLPGRQTDRHRTAFADFRSTLSLDGQYKTAQYTAFPVHAIPRWFRFP